MSPLFTEIVNSVRLVKFILKLLIDINNNTVGPGNLCGGFILFYFL